METIIKQAREVGTSAGVLLPRRWLNKEVIVTLYQPSFEELAKEAFEILVKHKLNEDVLGIYLYGSYAREENEPESDIDILVITGNTSRLIQERNYELLLIAKDKLLKNLRKSLAYQWMIREARAIIDKNLLENMRKQMPVLNVQEQLSEIRSVTRINRDIIGTCEENCMDVPDGIVYSLVLRLRELYLMWLLKKNQEYMKREFIRKIGKEAYDAYKRVKNDEEELGVAPDKAQKVLQLIEKWQKELKE
ncbi:MAG TPA: DUF2080 family transposase-associated protein [Candidatus Nanoarchaeia archaeon]|nr:DUF2080 family transposase-associated protein [Candidatus Nanoarchaeia archaeon]